ncbi:sulfite oxidase s [Fusarium beomiforme]|uniref:Sulfite oxidase s n=1 Tax=Fusarium beomiforme TaxID=44412 RepID=A0A9P5DY92_9HYPO|nr:sulfite oxidase s [Fusarium beomiforme]
MDLKFTTLLDYDVSQVPPSGREREACTSIDPEGFFLRPPPTHHHLSSFVTPDDQLFQTIHMGAAVVDPEKWLLVIDGLVRRPFALTLEQLKALPQTSVTAFHECYGSPLKPPTSNPWRVGNVVWTGVRLSTILTLAEPLPGVRFVWSEGLDYGGFFEYEADRRLARDKSPKTGSSPRMERKWKTTEQRARRSSATRCSGLSLQETRAPGPFAAVLYNEKDPKDPEGLRMRPVWEVEVNSMITKPVNGEEISEGLITIEGWAWCHDNIVLVEVSKDEGQSWVRGKVEEKDDQAWQKFTAMVELEPGAWKLIARATSEGGMQQPLEGRRNHVHSITVNVKD